MEKIDTSFGIVILYKNKILLGHPTNDKWYGTYTIPKGHADDGEKPKTTAIRETFEEVGIKIPKKWLTDPYKLEYITKKKNLYYYIVRISDLSEIGLESEVVPKSQLQLKEINWAGFVDKKEAEKRIQKNQIPILKHLKMKVFESFREKRVKPINIKN